MEAKVKKKDFIRYDEGAERYSMSKHSFMKLAQEAHAVYKINRITLVSVQIFEEYLESFVCRFKQDRGNRLLYIKKLLTF